MADSYIRKFSPNKWHIIAILFLLASVVMFISGLHRASRVLKWFDMSTITMGEDSMEMGTGVDGVLTPIKLPLKGAVQQTDVCFLNDSGYNVYASTLGKERYSFIAVKAGSKEEQAMLAGEEVTSYYSEKYREELIDFLSDINKYYDTKDQTDEQKEYYGKLADETASHPVTLGLIVVDRNKELLSFLWFLPFLIVGLIMLKIGGSPFFYFPEEEKNRE